MAPRWIESALTRRGAVRCCDTGVAACPHAGGRCLPVLNVQPDVELVVPATSENVAVVRHVLAGIGEALGMDQESTGKMLLAVSEACTNVVVHAYEGEDDGTLEVDACVDGDLLRVVVRDRGVGLRLRPDSPGLGMGLPLIAAVTEQVEIADDGHGGNELRMTFAVPGPAATEDRPLS